MYVPDLADRSAGDPVARLLNLRVVAEIEVRAMDQAAALGELEELGRLGRGHRQRLLADDVLARCQALLHLRIVQAAWGGGGNAVYPRIGGGRGEDSRHAQPPALPA